MSLNVFACLAACGLVLCSGCEMLSRDSIRGSGVAATETRSVERFDRLDLSGSGSVRIRIGSPQSVQITADDNLLSLLECAVRDDRCLHLYNSGSYSTSQPLVWEITAESLSQITASGSLEITLDGFDDADLKLDLSGAVRLVGKGKAVELEIISSGGSTADLSGLSARQATVVASGASVARVLATRKFDGTADGASRIECRGNPPERSEVAGGASRITIE